MPDDLRRVIILLIDGARPDVMRDEMDQGNLPHLHKLAQQGCFQKIVSSFPSTTGPAYLPYLTGCYPSTCGIPGIRWFDKNQYAKRGWGPWAIRSYCGPESLLLERDMNPQVVTAWELFEKPRGIFPGITKGLGKGDLTRFSRLWHYYYAHLTDRWSYLDQKACEMTCQVIARQDFDFLFTVFPGVDEYSHLTNPSSERVRQAYRDVDAHCGKIFTALEQSGFGSDTAIAIVADHGLSATHSHFDVGPWLEDKKKLRTLYHTHIFKFRFDAASMVSGNGMCHVYLRGQKGWQDRMSFEAISAQGYLIDEFAAREEIALVLAQGMDRSIHLISKNGHGQFHETDSGQFVYHFLHRDPLEIFPIEKARESIVLTDLESRQLTWSSHFPDVFRQVWELFKSPRVGDIVLSAQSGFDLRKKFEHPEHKSSHGSLCPEHMFVPLITNLKINGDYIRSIDVFPTLLQAVAKEGPSGVEGRSCYL